MKCNKVHVKLKDSKDPVFMEQIDFLVDGAAPSTIIVRLDIAITGKGVYVAWISVSNAYSHSIAIGHRK